MKSFLQGQYQNMILIIYNRKLTELQGSFKLYNKICGINLLWYITSFYVNQEGKN